jgi:ABC-type glycerol-3-phosphate transport system substrate-binding protein
MFAGIAGGRCILRLDMRGRISPGVSLRRNVRYRNIGSLIIAITLILSCASCKGQAKGPTTLPTKHIVEVDPQAYRYYVGKQLEYPAVTGDQKIQTTDVVTTETGFAIVFSIMGDFNGMEYSFDSYLWVYDKTGAVVSKTEIYAMETTPAGQCLCVSVDPNGGFAALFEPGYENYQLIYFSDDGQKKGESVPLAGLSRRNYPQSLLITEEEILIGCDGIYCEYSRDGQSLRTIENDDIWAKLVQVGEDILIEGYLSDPASGSGNKVLFEIPETGDTLSEPVDFQLPDDGFFSSDGELYATNSECFYRYDTTTESIYPILFWTKTDLVVSRSEIEMKPLSESEYLCIQTAYNTQKLTISILTRQPEDYLSGKTVLTIAGVGIGDARAFQQAAVDFNRQSEEYRIEIVDYLIRYADYLGDYNPDNYDAMEEQIRLEILAGKGPDIILGQYSDDFSAYSESGLLVDLLTYMNQDASFDSSLYVQSVWNTASEEGTMYTLPLAFYLDGMFASQDLIGDRTGWTPEEFNAMASALPAGTRSFYEGFTQSELLKKALPYSIETLIDSKTGEVNFDSPEFAAILDFAKTYGTLDSIINSADSFPDYGDPYARFGSGEIVFSPNAFMSTPWDYAATDNFLGNSGISFCGYPCASKAGPMACIIDSVAIVDKEAVSDGCWQFIKTLLSETNQRRLTATIEEDCFRMIPMLNSLLEEFILTSQEGIMPGQDIDSYEREAKPATAEQTEAFRKAIDGVTIIKDEDTDIIDIVLEEAAAYFTDQKSRDDVIAIIQNRVQTLISERM